MKKIIFSISLIILISIACKAEFFRFALISDLHIQLKNLQPDEDLQNVVNEINSSNDIDFVIISGDVTESGDLTSLIKVKRMLDNLLIPYYVIPGNHETKWSESGATDFAKIFGSDRFSFTHKGFNFIGFNSGPIIKMGDGHISPQDIDWVRSQLKTVNSTPVIAVTHYPLLKGDVDNWYEIIDVLRKCNIQAVLSGHYHRNAILNYDGITGIVNRSALRANGLKGGYSIYSVSDSILVYEKIIGKSEMKWLSIPVEKKHFDNTDLSARPSYAVNNDFKNVTQKWRIETRSGIYLTPAVAGKFIFYGDDSGAFYCLNKNSGKQVWKFKTNTRIISSPAVDKKHVVFGSTDGNVYCLDTKTGNLIWKYETLKAVMGCPLIQNDTVFIGGSDGCFRAFDISNGKVIWTFNKIENYTETRPVIFKSNIMFGAWDSYFYALNISNGSLVWKWNNGSHGIHFSPAAVIPVVSHNKVFFTAPDRYITALDVETGKIVWRTNRHEVRESIGLSEDGNAIFCKCMNDSVVAIDTRGVIPKLLWKINASFGYDHNACMLPEKNGKIIFGTKNGLLTAINTKNGKVLWKHKIGNCIINTICYIDNNECIITTTEGIIARIKY